ncbi:restriction endonuclease subunit S [Bacillus tequilensis]|uniref:restriction endonuclease subunit S n=1 Tax=Bacillus tequilensis TaxID=227866 RepID=UPI0015756DAE|nr:restriction endonuclease subunit S [Bacillus tequilensis]NTU27291.1 restriction endonuclease subunit S [Bacillus tequilensis]
MENKRVPEVRFAGFIGNWEERKLGDLADFSKGSGYSKGDLTDKGKPIILYGRLYTKYETVIDCVDTFTIEKKKSVLSKGNEVIIPSSGETAEDISRASAVSRSGIILGGDLNIVHPFNVIDPVFLALTISNGKQQKELSRRAQGKSVVHLHNSDLKGVNLLFPIKEEQTKIGTFFKQLDDTIALHQQELTTLKQTKQGFLQKMFPKEGEFVPEVRFPGFTGDWKERKLGDLSEIRRGASPRPIQDPKWFDDESDVGWLRISDVTEQNGLIYHVEQHISVEGQKKTIVLNEPHLILSIAATVGKPVINYIKTGIHDGFIVFINPNFNIDFMFQWLEMFRPKWQKYGQPGSQVNINSELVREQGVVLPSLEEQEKISNFFKQLDDTIALHQHELDALKETKKAFLQKMFV